MSISTLNLPDYFVNNERRRHSLAQQLIANSVGATTVVAVANAVAPSPTSGSSHASAQNEQQHIFIDWSPPRSFASSSSSFPSADDFLSLFDENDDIIVSTLPAYYVPPNSPSDFFLAPILIESSGGVSVMNADRNASTPPASAVPQSVTSSTVNTNASANAIAIAAAAAAAPAQHRAESDVTELIIETEDEQSEASNDQDIDEALVRPRRTANGRNTIRHSERRLFPSTAPVDVDDDVRTVSPDVTTTTTTTTTPAGPQAKKRHANGAASARPKKTRTAISGAYDLIPLSELEMKVETECNKKSWACKLSDDKQHIEHDLGCPIGKKERKATAPAPAAPPTASSTLSSLPATATSAQLHAQVTLLTNTAPAGLAAQMRAHQASRRTQQAQLLVTANRSIAVAPAPVPPTPRVAPHVAAPQAALETLLSHCNDVIVAAQAESATIQDIILRTAAQQQAYARLKPLHDALHRDGTPYFGDSFLSDLQTATQQYTTSGIALNTGQDTFMQQALILEQAMQQLNTANAKQVTAVSVLLSKRQ
jgi:hypothetical protein